MTNQEACRAWAKLHALDVRNVKRSISMIRSLRTLGAEDLEQEIADVCYWFAKARESRREGRLLKGGAL